MAAVNLSRVGVVPVNQVLSGEFVEEDVQDSTAVAFVEAEDSLF